MRSLKPLRGMLTGYENSYESPVNHCCLYATAIYYILLIIHGEKLSVSRLYLLSQETFTVTSFYKLLYYSHAKIPQKIYSCKTIHEKCESF